MILLLAAQIIAPASLVPTVAPHVSTAPGYAVALPTVPGALNPVVTQDNIKSTICVSGWTKTIRPPVSYTNKVKFALMDAQGIPRADARQFELDHETPLEDGGDAGYTLGANGFPLNLWLQPYRGKYCSKWCSQDKDMLETLLKRLVCNGTIPLAEAQRELQTDWVAAWLARIGNESDAGRSTTKEK